MTKSEKEQWELLYNYVKCDILNYQDKVMPKMMILRLKGLAEGKFMANKKVQAHAKYDYSVILLTFKLCKAKLSSYLMGEFKNEAHKINGIMLIVESEINNTVEILNRKKVAEEKVGMLNVDVHSHDSAEYKKRGTVVKNNKLKDLW
jgi:hypothetical protein